MAATIAPLPLYPSAKARATLSPSQAANLTQTILSAVERFLAFPDTQLDTPSTRGFVASYAKDAAQQALQSLIWESEHKPRTPTHAERRLRRCVFALVERLCALGSMSLETLIDIGVTYDSLSAVRLRALFSSAFSAKSAALLSDVPTRAIPAFMSLLSSPSQGLYGPRRTSHILLVFLRPSPPEVRREFARNAPFMRALATAYHAGLASLAQTYGGFRVPADGRPLDEWERIFLETKVALLDAFHVLVRTLIEDIAAIPTAGAALAAQCEPAFDVIFALLDTVPPPAPANATTAPTPFVDRPLLADYQHAYDLSRTLSDALKRADDVRTELLEATLRGLDDTSGPPQPGVLKLIIRSSGVPPGVDVTRRPAGDAKGKGREVAPPPPEEDPVVDMAVSQVLELLPEHDADYIRYVLTHDDYPYRGDPEKLIGALLEGTAPPLADVQAHLLARATGPAPPARQVGELSYTQGRRNVFDEEKIDLSTVRIGKKDDAASTLQDRAFMEQMKADILRRAEALSDDEDEEEEADGRGKGREAAFEDDLDDGGGIKVRDGDASDEGDDSSDGEDQTEGTAATPETICELAYLQDAKVFDRDAQTRRSKARADLRARTNWSDEQLEGWRIMLERNPKKDKILGKHEFSGNAVGTVTLNPESGRSTPRGGGPSRGRGGGGGRGRGRGRGGGGGAGSGGGEGGSARDRAWKDKNKASRGNHNRKRGHDKKMAQAGGPSA